MRFRQARFPARSASSRVALAALILAAGGAAAQQASLLEKGYLQLRYGVSLRSGAQEDLGPGLTYDGLTPNDLALSGAWFPSEYAGLSVSAQREAFSLLEADHRVASGALVRASVGPTGRIVFGVVRIEAQVGYQFAQLPVFGSSAAVDLRPAQRHAVLLASRASIALPLGIVAEARGELPIAVAASDAGSNAVSTSGFSAGGGISLPVYERGGLEARLALDYQYVTDTVRGPDALVSSQKLSRVGAALRLGFGVPARGVVIPRLGGVTLQVVDAQSGAPLGGVTALLEREGATPVPMPLSEDGRAQAEGIAPGAWIAKVAAAGYLPVEARADVVAGQTAALTLRLEKAPPAVGGLLVQVTESDGKTAVANATVRVNGVEQVTDAAGWARFGELPPGALAVAINAEGFVPGDEAAQIVAGSEAQIAVQLQREKEKVPATISGVVRSVRGKRVRALLAIPELRRKIQADAKGTFAISVPAGTYRVIISAPGFRTQTKQVTVKEGDQTIFNVDLHPR